MSHHDMMTIAISEASKLTRNAIELNDLYLEIPDLIDAEHIAIEQCNLSDVEKIGATKSEVGEKIEAGFQVHARSVEMLISYYRANIDNQKEYGRGLLGCIELLKDIEQKKMNEPSALGPQVLSENIKLLEASLQQLKSSFERIQPMIEKNRVVIQKMIEVQRENYNFWTKIAKEESSSYDASGSQNPVQGQNSLLNVRV